MVKVCLKIYICPIIRYGGSISHDPYKAINLKLLLYLFELMSGLKINYQKSEIYLVGGDNILANYYSSLFGCQVGTLTMKCLDFTK
jgi:hypothetical protein